MEVIELPITSPVYRGVRDKELSDENRRIIDGYINEVGAFVSRPGLELFKNLGIGRDAIDGMYWWDEKELLIVVAGGYVYKIEYDGTTITQTYITGVKMVADTRPDFATDGDNLVITAGGAMVRTDGTTLTAFFTDPDVPSPAHSVAFLDSYILAADNDRFYWSDVQSINNWGALNFASAPGLPDKIKRMVVVDRQIYLMGNRSVEIWENDGANPFSRIPGGFAEIGVEAPKSVIDYRGTLFWLARNKEEISFVQFAGGNWDRITSPFDREIAGFATKKDCLADRVAIDGKPFLVFHFPSAEKTYVYNLLQKNWCEFGNYVASGQAYKRWKGNCVAYVPQWNITFVGDNTRSYIYTMSRDHLDDDGDEIRPSILTGHLTHGTNNHKRGNKLTLRARRGYTTGSSAPTVVLRTNDNGSGQWVDHEFNLGETGDVEMFVELYKTGIYRSRQYEIYTTDSIELSFQDLQESVEVLSR